MRHRVYAGYLQNARQRLWPVWRPSVGWAVASGLTFALAFLGLSRVSEFLYYQF
jgi:hypothetical protein